MPRRKYGHMVGACPPTPPEKCRICRMGKKSCPVHKDNKTRWKERAIQKRRKFSGGKKGKKRTSKGDLERQRRKEKNNQSR